MRADMSGGSGAGAADSVVAWDGSSSAGVVSEVVDAVSISDPLGNSSCWDTSVPVMRKLVE